MDKADKKALINSIIFGLVVAVFFVPQLNTVPVSAVTTYSSSHTQLYKNIFQQPIYEWWTDQTWSVSDNQVIYESYYVGSKVYSPLHYFRGVKAHTVTYRSPGSSYWKIATRVEFGSFWWVFPHSMTAKCYNTGGVTWYNSWT